MISLARQTKFFTHTCRRALSLASLNMRVISLPLNDDNYGYLVVDDRSKKSLIVDVSSQPDKIRAAAQQHHVTPEMVLTTHKHWDHAGGNNRIKELFPGQPTYTYI